MEFTLSNDRLQVTTSETRAELQSIKLDGEEHLWQADPAIWGRHAPILFPFIARLRDGYNGLDGERVGIPTHGFCRTRPFRGAMVGLARRPFHAARRLREDWRPRGPAGRGARAVLQDDVPVAGRGRRR